MALIEKNGQKFLLEKASVIDLPEVKELDDLAFGAEKGFPGVVGISVQELNDLVSHGVIVTLREKETNKLVAHGQLLLETTNGHCLKNSTDSFCYGFAVHPDYQGKGLGKLMIHEQKKLALDAGRTRMNLTVRVGNTPSMGAFFSEGFHVTYFHSEYYGSFPYGARLEMEKDLTVEMLPNNEEIVGVLCQAVLIPVIPGPLYDVDLDALRVVASLAGDINTGSLRGVGLLPPKDGKAQIVFKKVRH